MLKTSGDITICGLLNHNNEHIAILLELFPSHYFPIVLYFGAAHLHNKDQSYIIHYIILLYLGHNYT